MPHQGIQRALVPDLVVDAPAAEHLAALFLSLSLSQAAADTALAIAEAGVSHRVYLKCLQARRGPAQRLRYLLDMPILSRTMRRT
jgi:hypothetical protein